MFLGDFRKKTACLDDDVELMILIEEKNKNGIIIQDEIIAPVNTLDFDSNIDSGSILTVTDAEAGSYSL